MSDIVGWPSETGVQCTTINFFPTDCVIRQAEREQLSSKVEFLEFDSGLISICITTKTRTSLIERSTTCFFIICMLLILSPVSTSPLHLLSLSVHHCINSTSANASISATFNCICRFSVSVGRQQHHHIIH